jgi:hypothetical protein
MTELAIRSCMACGQQLARQRADARFCGDTCRKRGERGRHRAGVSRREARRRDLSVTPTSRSRRSDRREMSRISCGSPICGSMLGLCLMQAGPTCTAFDSPTARCRT